MGCPTCGEPLDPAEESCAHCGWRPALEGEPGHPEVRRPGRPNPRVVLAAALGLVVGIVLGATGAVWVLSTARQVERLVGAAPPHPGVPRSPEPPPAESHPPGPNPYQSSRHEGGDRARAIDANCDGLFHALDGQLANEIDWVAGGSGRAACGCETNECVIACTLDKHRHESNPRNRSQVAFTKTSTQLESCQVLLEPYGTAGVTVSQRRDPQMGLRSFRIWVD